MHDCAIVHVDRFFFNITEGDKYIAWVSAHARIYSPESGEPRCLSLIKAA